MPEQLVGWTGAVARCARGALLAGIAAASLGVGDAGAWSSHFLIATARNGADSDTSTDPNDPLVEALDQQGGAGTGGATFSHASVNSDTGVVLAESSFTVGSTYPTASMLSTIASLEQSLAVQEIGSPVTVRFLLQTSVSASFTQVAAAVASARLDVGTLCRVSVRVVAGADPDVGDGCTNVFQGGKLVFAASASPDAIQVEATWAADNLPAAGIDFHVQVESDLTAVQFGATAEALASGVLSVEVEGAGSYAFTSPTFLTVPEPGGAEGLAIAVLRAVAVARRRRRPAR
jgi:hypothetical protein